jgi:OOP family OmpA-OmpF porin
LANRGFEVGFAETNRGPVAAEAMVDATRVVLVGTLPDEQSVTDLQAAASEVWGPGNVDATGLTVGETTWTDGVVRFTGSTTPTDDRPTRFGELVKERVDALIVIDTSGLSIVDNTAELEEVQTTVDGLVTASPIQFAPDSPVISDESDAVLTEVAASLNQVPDAPVEVVGHTDDVGDEQDNLVLSQQRAEAVVARLAELGVDPGRMTSRGEGEANPIADNTTDEGKAANRRIEFILV